MTYQQLQQEADLSLFRKLLRQLPRDQIIREIQAWQLGEPSLDTFLAEKLEELRDRIKELEDEGE